MFYISILIYYIVQVIYYLCLAISPFGLIFNKPSQ